MTKKRFADKVFIITGAAGGIGYAVAELAAYEGASIVFSDLKEEDGQQAKEQLNKITPRIDFLPMDMTVEENVKHMVEFTAEKYGRIDVLVNNAGITGQPGAVHNMEASMFKKVFDCNVMTMFYCAHYTVKQMLKQDTESAIVNVASIAGLLGFPGNAAYVTSKHAVSGLTKCMALDYAMKGIRVNAVSPGIIRTPMQEAGMEFLKERSKNNDEKMKTAMPIKILSPQNRVAEPWEVAQAILFLASAEASHITGINLPVDGGLTAY